MIRSFLNTPVATLVLGSFLFGAVFAIVKNILQYNEKYKQMEE